MTERENNASFVSYKRKKENEKTKKLLEKPVGGFYVSVGHLSVTCTPHNRNRINRTRIIRVVRVVSVDSRNWLFTFCIFFFRMFSRVDILFSFSPSLFAFSLSLSLYVYRLIYRYATAATPLVTIENKTFLYAHSNNTLIFMAASLYYYYVVRVSYHRILSVRYVRFGRTGSKEIVFLF